MTATAALTLVASDVKPFASKNEKETTKVLLVEDDPAVLEELHDVIQLEGWKPLVAPSVEVAMKLLKSDPDIRVVVTDVHFVGHKNCANGIQFVSRARAKFADRALTFVVLSGDPDKARSSNQEGAFMFLPKPLNPERLVVTISNAIACGDGVPETPKPSSIEGEKA